MIRLSPAAICLALSSLFLAVDANIASGQNAGWVPKQPAGPAAKSNADQSPSKQADNPAPKRAEWQLGPIETGWRIGSIVGPPLLLCGLMGVVLAAGAWLYVKLSATTDPRKLVESDPWIRARLEQLEAEQSGGPDEPGSVEENKDEAAMNSPPSVTPL
jgi:hypothetical protein